MVLHVGLPKSGTTHLQHSLAANAEALADRGVLYPQTADDVMFRAALDVRGNHKAWGRPRSRVQGTWDLLCAQARRHTGTHHVRAHEPESLEAHGPAGTRWARRRGRARRTAGST